MNPSIKKYHQIYTIGKEKNIYIGRGLEKINISNPEEGFKDFLLKLDGNHTMKSLKKIFPKAEQWLSMLEETGVVEWGALDYYNIHEPSHPLNKYSRQIYHMSLYNHPLEESIKFQEKICNSRIALLGTGAGGTTLGRFLSTLGFGFFRIVDFDILEESNLVTHVMLNENDIGEYKINFLEQSIKHNNSAAKVEKVNTRISKSEDIDELIKDCDFVIQAFDKPIGQVKSWVNKACVKLNKPYASIGQTDKSGRVGNIVIPGETACSECIGTPDINIIKEHIAAPLTASLVTVLAGILSHEIVKYVSGYAPSALINNTLLIDSETWEIHHIKHQRNTDCKICGSK